MAEAELLTIHTDGGVRGNPGPAAFAYVIDRDGHPPIEEADRIGQTTNNQAEYTALVRALQHALTLGDQFRVVVHSDSELMVKQLREEYRVKNEELRPLYERALSLSERFQGGVRFVHVRREKNLRADQLCNEALDGIRMTTFFPELEGRKPSVRAVENQSTESKRHPPVGLEGEALDCLRKAGVSSPETVWRQLARLIEKHLVAQLRPE